MLRDTTDWPVGTNLRWVLPLPRDMLVSIQRSTVDDTSTRQLPNTSSVVTIVVDIDYNSYMRCTSCRALQLVHVYVAVGALTLPTYVFLPR